jgi:hypothetical protein
LLSVANLVVAVGAFAVRHAFAPATVRRATDSSQPHRRRVGLLGIVGLLSQVDVTPAGFAQLSRLAGGVSHGGVDEGAGRADVDGTADCLLKAQLGDEPS